MIDCIRTAASYGSDPTHQLVTNTWLLGDAREVLVIDPANDPAAILAAIGDRRVVAVACTNGAVDHVNAAPAVAEASGAPVLVHAADHRLYATTNPSNQPNELNDDDVLRVSGLDITVLHTPGYTRGSVSLYAPAATTVFTGDTLALQSPPKDSRDRLVHLTSIRERLLTLPGETLVRRGHGDSTRISEHLDQA